MFRFTIRELLTLTLAAGLAVGWWLDHRAMARETESWRKIAGGLEYFFNQCGLHVGLKDGRLWCYPVPFSKRGLEIGVSEREPRLGTKYQDEYTPLEFYYSNWPRKP
jgi:hypothetical protein